MRLRHWAAVFGAITCLAAAADPSERLSDPAKEARARALFQETRCLVCQGESIDDSDTPLAADLRRAIRERLAAGASNSPVRAFLSARYGEFVLFRPRMSWTNAFLWSGPFLVAVFGAVLLMARQRRRAATEPELNPEEEARIAGLVAPPDTVAPKLGSKKARGLTER
jgi:cytochrome c-type biogenesis protein CcmH